MIVGWGCVGCLGYAFKEIQLGREGCSRLAFKFHDSAHVLPEKFLCSPAYFVWFHTLVPPIKAGLAVSVIIGLRCMGRLDDVLYWIAAASVGRGNGRQYFSVEELENRILFKIRSWIQNVIRLAEFTAIRREVGTFDIGRIYRIIGLYDTGVHTVIAPLLMIKVLHWFATSGVHVIGAIRHLVQI